MFSHVNARLICPKGLTFQQHLSMTNSTLCAITEAWLPNEKEDQKYKEVPHQVTRFYHTHIMMEREGVALE